jgi:predicted kinase
MLTALADLNLGMGLGVVLDSVAWTNAIRERWATLAESHGAPFLPIEMTCTDSAGRLDRLRTRWPSLSTTQLEERIGQEHARYEAWEMPSLTLDSTISLDELLNLALAAAATADRR